MSHGLFVKYSFRLQFTVIFYLLLTSELPGRLCFGLGFVTLGPFHCAYIYLCLSVCILCIFVSRCIVVVLL